MKSILLLSVFTLFSANPALAASTLQCSVKKYTQATGGEADCGSFSFKLPRENAYGFGKGECEGLELYTSWQKGSIEAHAFELHISASKEDGNKGFAISRFEGTFPRNFTNQFLTADGIVFTSSCSVKN